MLLRLYEHDHEERRSIDKDILPVLYSKAGKANHRSRGKPQRNDQYQRTNPRDRTGRLTTCLNCKSNEHWVNNCPEKKSRSCWRCSSTYHLLKDCPESDPVGYGGFGANGTVYVTAEKIDAERFEAMTQRGSSSKSGTKIQYVTEFMVGPF